MDAFKTPPDKHDSPGVKDSAGGEPPSATGIFGTVATPPARLEEDLFASHSAPAFAPAHPVQTPPSAAPATSAGPGEFTRMLQALQTPVQAVPQVSKPAEELARVFSHVSLDKKAPAEPAMKSEMPGESGQAPRPLNPVPGEHIDLGSPVFERKEAPGSSPGSFTQMFNAINPKAAAEPGVGTVPTAATQISRPLAASGPGEFTKIFQGLQQEGRPRDTPLPAVSPVPPQNNESGAFTRMFSNQSAGRVPQEDPLKSFKPEPLRERGFPFTESPARPVEPVLPAQGGFTQLLQALNPEPAAKVADAPMSPSPLPSPAPASTAGGFTQLLQNLSAQPASPPAAAPLMPPYPAAAPMAQPPLNLPPITPPMIPPAAVAPPVVSGPGEFTRVISGSALRDLQGPTAAPTPPAAAAPAGQAGWSPMSIPQAPAIPQAQPAPPAAPHFAPASFAFPPAPAPTPPPAPAPAPGGLQKYLPLILVLNVFLLLVIALILIFVLRHR